MATKSRQKEALAVDRPEGFLKRERIAQRIGTAVLALLLVAGASGLFGDGPLSDATITTGGVSITFERFTRQTYRTGLDVAAAGADDATVEIRLDRQFLTNVDVLEVRPFGVLRRLEADAAVFEVPAAAGRAFLQLQYEPKRYGILETDVAVAGHTPVHVRQVVFF